MRMSLITSSITRYSAVAARAKSTATTPRDILSKATQTSLRCFARRSRKPSRAMPLAISMPCTCTTGTPLSCSYCAVSIPTMRRSSLCAAPTVFIICRYRAPGLSRSPAHRWSNGIQSWFMIANYWQTRSGWIASILWPVPFDWPMRCIRFRQTTPRKYSCPATAVSAVMAVKAWKMCCARPTRKSACSEFSMVANTHNNRSR